MRRIPLPPLALALGAALAPAPLVLAQQPPPAWKQGQSPELADSPLAPVPLPPTPTPAKDIPVDKIKLPPGFTISVWADGLHNARQMARGSRGTLFVGSRVAGNVYAVVDRDGRREVKVIAKGLAQPNGVAFKDGALYVAEIPRLLKYENIEANLDSPPDPKVVHEFPKDAHHNWRFLLWGPDGKLCFNMGAPCDTCMPPVPAAVPERRLHCAKGLLESQREDRLQGDDRRAQSRPAAQVRGLRRRIPAGWQGPGSPHAHRVDARRVDAPLRRLQRGHLPHYVQALSAARRRRVDRGAAWLPVSVAIVAAGL